MKCQKLNSQKTRMEMGLEGECPELCGNKLQPESRMNIRAPSFEEMSFFSFYLWPMALEANSSIY